MTDSMYCPECRLLQPARHRYCARCGTALPRHLLDTVPAKATRMFAGIKVGESDPEAAFLRVSCYLKEQTFEAPEGTVTIPGHHVRFSIWVDDRVECALSVPEAEAVEMCAFVRDQLGQLSGTNNTV